MIKKYNPATSMKIFDIFLSNIKLSIQKNTFPVLGYSRDAIDKRLLQQFVNLELYNFKRETLKYQLIDMESILNQKLIILNRFKYNSYNGKILINKKFFAKNLIKFILQWFLVLSLHFKALFSFIKKNNKYATIVFGVHESSIFNENNIDSKFIRFCKDGPINPLREASSLIVYYNGKRESLDPDYIEYSKAPLHALLHKNKFSIIDFFIFFRLHVKVFYWYFRSIFTYPLMSTLYDDFSYHAMIANLDRKKVIENIVISLSDFLSQPLWMSSLLDKNFSTHMVWYSQNGMFFPLYKTDPVKYPYTHLTHIMVDEHWVWTKFFLEHLKKIGVTGIFHAVGPILWYLPEQKPSVRNRKCVNVCIFDITPASDELAKIYGEAKQLPDSTEIERFDYISPKNSSNFILDILFVINNIKAYSKKEIKISLKHKREYLTNKHDKGYIKLINDLLVNNEILIVDPSASLYSLIFDSNLIIVFPYSSPTYVADYMNVPAIYFDPTESIIPNYEKSDNIVFASGKTELEKQMNHILS